MIQEVTPDSGIGSSNSTPIEPTPSTSRSEMASNMRISPAVNVNEEELSMDETIMERLVGLTEMFPTSLRNYASSTKNFTVKSLSVSYSVLCKVTWFVSTTALLLTGPAMFEIERQNAMESMKMDRNKLLLGPGTTSSESS